MRNGVTVGGLLEEISGLEKLSAECGGISNSGRSATNQKQAREYSNLAGSRRIAVWCPVWQHLWLTGSGEGKGELCSWHPAVRVVRGDNESSCAPKQAAATVTNSEMARIFRVILQQQKLGGGPRWSAS